jgi:hypothetical protein
LVTSAVPSVQLVELTVPAVESTVVVPAAVQFQFGELAKVHVEAFTFTDGGSVAAVAVHVSVVHALASSQLAIGEIVPHGWQVPLQFADKHCALLEHATPLASFAAQVVPPLQYWLPVHVFEPQVAALQDEEPTHKPLVHTSPVVELEPSLHDVPLALTVVIEQMPVVGSHTPGS